MHHFIFIPISPPSLSALFPVRVCAHVHVCLWMDVLVISVKEKSQKVRLIKENLYTVKFTFMYSSESDKLQLCTKTVKTTCSSSLPTTCSDPVINLHPAPPCCQSPVSSALLVSPFRECKAEGTAHTKSLASFTCKCEWDWPLQPLSVIPRYWGDSKVGLLFSVPSLAYRFEGITQPQPAFEK